MDVELVRAGDHVEDALRTAGVLSDGEVVTGWLLVYEATDLESAHRETGHVCGPQTEDWGAFGMALFAAKRLAEGG